MKEAKARIKINRLLEEAGWRLLDGPDGIANIVLEDHVKITEKMINELGKDFERTKDGFVDFLLLNEKGHPLIVLEAKAEDKSPLIGKEQARKYARSENCRFVILSNGNLHYFWDLERGNPYVITRFPKPDSVEGFRRIVTDPVKMVNEPVDEGYIARTMDPGYFQNPQFLNDETRREFVDRTGIRFLRHYQIKAVKYLQDAVRHGNDRFLFEMATGTGKTLVAASVCKLFLRTGNAHRVLFLVDRLELENQAWKSFVQYLKNDYQTVIYKENRDDWKKAEIVVTTVQSLLIDNKFRRLFSPTDFDLVISDEAHRSIGGNARAVFEYFIGYKLGLTATPKDYLKKFDAENQATDPREIERRNLLDTYKTFGCESGQPTYRYSLLDGVKDGYLISPTVVDARTDITTQLLSDEGYAVMNIDDEGEEEKGKFYHRDFEKKFFSEQTNTVFCKTFLENALRDPVSGEIGKTIVFCVSQNHAAKITQILNEMADKLYPGKYNSDFAVQVTSLVQGAQQMTINFSDRSNNLNGNGNFYSSYLTSKTRVCCTVGMMTTGYDCQDILNICLMRPIFSPTDFIQIKGRGTRTWKFADKLILPQEKEEFMALKKTTFKLFDFFANCEYFEEEYNYDEVLKLPAIRRDSTGESSEGPGIIKEYETFDPDKVKTLREKVIGLEGMKIDRMFFEKFNERIQSDPVIIENIQVGNWETVIDYVNENHMNKPEDYVTLEKLRKALDTDRRLSLREIIEYIFGLIPFIKSKDQLVEEEFEKFLSVCKPEEKDDILALKYYFKAYITDPHVREIINRKNYTALYVSPTFSMADFKAVGARWRTQIPEYIKDYVPLNNFM
ncbi:MAG: DEAD/DEAH box helicase family protein [Bacteroidales bacterium]|nr:DEAD/DEAH box helicase family protein [Bacteroidales bacterium]